MSCQVLQLHHQPLARAATAALLILLISGPALAEPEPGSGRLLFEKHCQICHGPEGHGDGPGGLALDPKPRDLTERPYKHGCCPPSIVRTLKSGVEGSGMPSFAEVLTVEEMEKLARYVRSIQKGCCQK